MALSKPRTIFGVHSVTPYSRTTKIPYGEAQVLQGSTFAMEGDTISLLGGSNKFSWQIEDGDIDATLSFTVSEYPNWLFELFGGKAPTQGTAETSGNISAVVDFNGTSVVAATGIASVTAIPSTGAPNLKFGKYTIEATAADAFKVYASSDADFGRGTDGSFLDDSLAIFSQTGATTGSTYDITAFGLRITMGASATAMTSGDTAIFEVRPINTFNRSVRIGGIADTFPEFGCLIYAQKSGSGALFEIDAFKMKAIGMNLGADRKAFGQSEYSAKASYDQTLNGICDIREVE
jgi:hypothetical protein